ncbi:uncharacterized protein LOC105436445 isoform X1 [Strongylocentrotus purpuratus]|uniref:Integrase catalytic domain-containing protein n=1 Tax=Strongylocentrotus purpuratus TaxID=7668 RepID=A0A7M7MZR5_STRPU|nr:uncharacterized protein LOC105436445 isoform X1 [Strongylocentrotus purpuratus]
MPLSEPALRREATIERTSRSKARSLAGVKFIKSDVEAEQCDAVITKATSVASSRMSRESVRLTEAFQAELAVMDQEDRLDALKAEREHAIYMRAVQKEERKLRKVKLRKETAARIAELEGDEESDGSEAAIEHITLPKEQPGDSVHRFFKSQQDVTIGTATPPLDGTSSQTGFEKMAESMTDMAKAIMQQNMTTQRLAVASQLPKLEIPIFSGDPLRYRLWKNAFSNLVDSKPLDGATKLSYLNSYVAGEPRKVVEHYILLGTDEAYFQATELLQKRYGSGSIISTAFSKKLSSWPRIFDKDPGGLRQFSDFLEQVVSAKSTESSLGILDYPQENIKMLNKLPLHLERSWRDEVNKWQTRGLGNYPPFEVFAEFVSRAANKANIPELEGLRSGEARPRQYEGDRSNRSGEARPRRYEGDRSNRNQPRGKTFATNVSSKTNVGEYSSCPYCGREHHLDDCHEFTKKLLHERKGFFFQKNLCMGCGVADSHQVKDCTQRKVCKVCEGRHLACLHRPRNNQRRPHEEGSSKCTNVCSLPDQDGQEHCMIVPVWVRCKDEPSREFLHYAILDDQSNVGFVSDELCEQLGVQGTSTTLRLTTMHATANVKSMKVNGLQVLDFNRENEIDLPPCFSRDSVPASRSQIPKIEVLKEWPHLEPVAHELMPYNRSVKVSLLIGNNCSRAIRPREVIAGGEDDPYAMKTALGWGVVGKVCQTSVQDDGVLICNRISAIERHPKFAYASKAKEILDTEKIIQILEQDFKDSGANGEPYSVEETRFMEILESGIRRRDDGHYEMPLPLKSANPNLPFNKPLAMKRWKQLSGRLRKNPKFCEDYRAFMDDVIQNYAERVPADRLQIQDRVNYIPHTGVYHPRKPNKIRVVFDCSATYQGVSLNDMLLQGPNTMNSLLGVLCRFRKEAVAVAADVKSMFHQFYAAAEDRDLLRFLWWEDGNPENAVVEYRMKVHLFGAASSPGVATFGLRRAADDGEEEYGAPAANYIRTDFYVDDGLRSEPDVASAIQLLKNSQAICAKAGLTLHKIVSNEREVQESFTKKEGLTDKKELGLARSPSTLERVLGVVWCIKNDVFNFKIELKERPFTRRGVLSTVSSFYDPCGFLSPVMLRGKQILQELCRSKLDWDSPIPEDLRPRWERWLQEVLELENLQIPRCYKPRDFGEIKAVELHHFSDASQEGYGQCSYIRLVNTQDKVHCSFVIGKSRVTPLKQVSIPRLELTAATVSARMSGFLNQELKYDSFKEFFWTDSKVVLGYIQNEARRFHVYVANRIQMIRDLTDPDMWRYVDTSENPADDASRGLSAKQLTQDSRWLRGPEFLWTDGIFEVNPTRPPVQLEESDPELKRATALKTGARDEKESHFETSRLDSFSNWHRAKKAVARCIQLKGKLQSKAVKISSSSPDAERPSFKESLSLGELQSAERVILKSVQAEHFLEEMQALRNLEATGEVTDRQATRARNAELKKTSCLYRLDPFLDEYGIIRVGGRIDRANISREIRHPIILPRKCHVTRLLIDDCHSRVNHMGRGLTHNELRQRGYWVIGGSSAVSQFISQCVTCRKLRGPLVQQKMSELPRERVEPSAPFTYCAVDYFGPFLLKEKRSEVKRYGVLFTCMSSRSIHLETANSLSSSSFINALRRFMNRRGTVRQLRSDQGTTFIGARNELKQALQEMDQKHVQEYLLENGVEWIPFKFNVPHSSHMGGVWERQIQTVRRALDTLLAKAGSQLDDESFRTFMTEAECIVNSRPLTTNNLSDAEAPEPLCPLHLLTMKPKVILPPPGNFQGEDKYSRKWWRRVQYLANEFWLRWRREYLQQLQPRQKWTRTQRDLAIGDVVIAKETEDVRLQWPLARVAEVFPSQDGRVRKVKLLMADGALDSNGKRLKKPCYLDRPVHKLVLLLPVEA